MELEFWLKAVMVVVGTALIAGGIVALFKSTKPAGKIWGAIACGAGVGLWAIVLFTTITSTTITTG